ncbi:MAG: hypothetical protein ABI686_00540 [Acidobacteriota bacterium]
MKFYLITTGASFLLILTAHIARVYLEGIQLLREPIFLFSSFLSIAFIVWAIFLLRKVQQS